MTTPPSDAHLDHGDDLSGDALPEDEQDLFVLFADGLDPNTPTTIAQAEAEWQELFS